MLCFTVLITKTQMGLNPTDNPTVNLLNPIRPFYRPLHSIKLLSPVNLRRPAQNICPPVYLEFINVTVTGQEMTLSDRPVHASLPSEWREQEVQGAGDNMWAHDTLKDQLTLFYSLYLKSKWSGGRLLKTFRHSILITGEELQAF